MLSSSTPSCYRVMRSSLLSTTCIRRATASRRTFASTKGPTVNDPLSLRRQAQEARQKRAKQLHDEIAGITQKQDRRHGDEIQKPKKAPGFSEFLSKNKTGLSVIVVSCLTVVLSAKLVQGNQKYRQLEKDLEDTQAQIQEKRQLLKTITSDEVVSQMAVQCANELNNNQHTGIGWLGGRSSGNDTTTQISTILAQNLASIIGDAALNDNEKNVKQLNDLNDALPRGDAALEALQQLGSDNNNDGAPSMTPPTVAGDQSNKKSVFVI